MSGCECDTAGFNQSGTGLVRVSSSDTTANFLANKLVAGTNVTLVPSGPGNETLTVNAAGGALDHKVSVSATDTTPGFLQQKLLAGVGISVTKENPAGNEDLKVALVSPIPAAVGVSPFRASRYSDPNFIGASNGSQSNPFLTVAAAFADMIAAGATSGIVYLPAGAVVNEAVTFPTSGLAWEIAALNNWGGANPNGTVLNGAITCNCTSAAIFSVTLTNLVIPLGITGDLTTATVGGALLFLNHCRVSGAVALTASGGGAWNLVPNGNGKVDGSALPGRITGAVSVAGRILASHYVFGAGCTYSNTSAASGSRFEACRFLAGAFVCTAIAGTDDAFSLCEFASFAVTFSATNQHFLLFDDFSWGSLLNIGASFVTPATLSAFNLSGKSATVVVAGNSGPNPLSQRPLPGMYQATATEDLLIAGTLGSAVVNIIYTDAVGVLQTKPVSGALNITSALGTETSGVLPFYTNGATAFQYSVTGIVTPGALSLQACISVQRMN